MKKLADCLSCTRFRLLSPFGYRPSSRMADCIKWARGDPHTLPEAVPRTEPKDASVVHVRKDHAQLNAIRLIYLAVHILLCWWHVLHAWQQHLSIKDFPELWELLKKWIRIGDEKEFQAAWKKIKDISSVSFRDYLKKNWIPCTFISIARNFGRDSRPRGLHRCISMVRCLSPGTAYLRLHRHEYAY